MAKCHAVLQDTILPDGCDGCATYGSRRFYFNEALNSSPQFHMASKMGFKLFPKSVSEYSTRGGPSAYTVRVSRPFFSRSWAVSTFGTRFQSIFLTLQTVWCPALNPARSILSIYLQSATRSFLPGKPVIPFLQLVLSQHRPQLIQIHNSFLLETIALYSFYPIKESYRASIML